jgi:hypothetical protein
MARQQSIGRKEAILGMMRGQVSQLEATFFPAPAGGLNRTDSVGNLPLTDAYVLTNMTANTQGVGVRPGFVNHVINIGGSIETDVRTVAAFNDVTRDQPTPRDKMFAFTEDGIYDVTSTGSNPTVMDIYDGIGSAVVLSSGWPTPGDDAGWVTTAASAGGKHYLLACDEVNGYFVYDPDGGGAGVGRWYKVKQGIAGSTIEGIDPTKFAHVMQWKGRLIFTEVDSSRAWYLTPGAIVGVGVAAPLAIDMGSRFIYGGYLKGCYIWTYDGGAGMDDFLVAISHGGDVVVWQGISPSDTSFQVKGVWYVGEPPKGRRVANAFGGDLLLLGSIGVIPLSALVDGGRQGEQQYITYKIQDLVRKIFREQGNLFGWGLGAVPKFGGYIITIPLFENVFTQLFLAITTSAWSLITGIPALSWVEFRGTQYFSTYDGRVCELDGSVDTTQVAEDEFTEDPVDWQLLTAFTPIDAPANWKMVQLIRPVFLAEQLPTYNVGVRYDFDVVLPTIVNPSPPLVGAIWDIAEWDEVYWGGQFVTEQPTVGAVGVGRFVAVVISGRSSVPTNIVGFNLLYKQGGLL